MINVIYCKNHDEEKKFFNEILNLCKEFKIGLIAGSLPLISNLSLIENIALPASFHQGLTIKEVRHKTDDLLKEYGLKNKIHYRKNQLNNFEEFIVKYIASFLYNPRYFVFFNPLQTLFGHHRKMFYDFLGSKNTEKFVIIEDKDFEALINQNIKHKVVLFEQWVTQDLKA